MFSACAVSAVACAAQDPDRAAVALHAHLELATDIYRVELAGRSIFAC